MLNHQEEKKPIMELVLGYSLTDKNGKEITSGEARAEIKKEILYIFPKLEESLTISFRDIFGISEADYQIYLNLSSGEKIILFNLGYQYEDFLRVLSKMRNELLLKDLLMQEGLKKSGLKAEFVYFDRTGKELQKGKCEIRLYETAMVTIPEKGEFLRIPYSDFLEIKEEDYAITCITEFEEKIVFTKMGEQLDSFKEALSERVNELSLKIQMLIKELVPDTDPLTLRKAARLMKEGRAARKSDIEEILPALWEKLEKRLETLGIKEEYNFLSSLAQKEKICIGLKRGLMGDLTGDYIWFLIPIYNPDKTAPGNAIAMEATSEGQSGKATYFFKICGREEYKKFGKIEDLHKKVDELIKEINRAMVEINFRREPIYLPEEKLEESRYKKYRFAIEKLPALKILRSLFIGRILHISFEQWKEDVTDLLKFNVSTTDDGLKWVKDFTNQTENLE